MGTSLQDDHAFAGGCEHRRADPSAGAAANDDHIGEELIRWLGAHAQVVQLRGPVLTGAWVTDALPQRIVSSSVNCGVCHEQTKALERLERGADFGNVALRHS